MTDSAISFHFVDRIVELDLDAGARGTLEIPADLSSFPASLLVEAIGQLAAWLAMRRADFTRRPVAALAGEVRVLGLATPGRRIDLEVAIRSCKQVAIAYDGVARADGETLVELADAAGAMVAMAAFEAPDDARARFERLLGDGLPPRRFPDRERFGAQVIARNRESEGRLTGELEVAPVGELYADHFPRRPVYPATLLLDAQLRLALELVFDRDRNAPPDDADLIGAHVRKVKVRRFTPPGSRVAIAAEVIAGTDAEGPLEVSMTSSVRDQRASSATVLVPRRTR